MARTPELMLAGRAAEFLGIGRNTLSRWNRAGIGPPRTRKGKRYGCSREALKEWLKSGAVTLLGAGLPTAGKTKGDPTNGGVGRYHR
jgi:hypothetical protein